jgi:hypothetical protein
VKSQENGKCLWYSQYTGVTPPNNCAYDGDAIEMTDAEGLSILQDRCPHLIQEGNTFILSWIKLLLSNIIGGGINIIRKY